MTFPGEPGRPEAGGSTTVSGEGTDVEPMPVSGDQAAGADWAGALLGRVGVSAPQFLVFMLAEVWLLNVADLLLTRYVLHLGFATESNAVMDYFIQRGALSAGAFKLGIVTVGVVLLWLLRRRRGVVLGAVLLAAVFAAVVAYQLAWVIGR